MLVCLSTTFLFLFLVISNWLIGEFDVLVTFWGHLFTVSPCVWGGISCLLASLDQSSAYGLVYTLANYLPKSYWKHYSTLELVLAEHWILPENPFTLAKFYRCYFFWCSYSLSGIIKSLLFWTKRQGMVVWLP